MIEAVLGGKLVSLNSEDALTAAAFGRLRYLPPAVLVGWLNAATALRPTDQTSSWPWATPEIGAPEVAFWPRWPETLSGTGTVEPDVVLFFGSAVVIVEAKLWSGKSGAGDDRDQIARQWKSGSDFFAKNSRALRVAAHIYVTPHLTMPSMELEESWAVLAKTKRSPPTLLWLPWSALAPLLEELPENLVAVDLLRYLHRVGVLRFVGWKLATPVPKARWVYSTDRRRAYWAQSHPLLPSHLWKYTTVASYYWTRPIPRETVRWGFNREMRSDD
jgi:hypothetical protein